MEFFSRFRNPLVLAAVVLAQVLGLALQVHRPLDQEAGPGASPDNAQITLLRRWTVAMVTPVERVTHGASFHLRHLWWNYLDLRHARDQTQQLEAEVQRLRAEQAAFAEDAAQGRRLQAVLGFQQQYITATVAAQVIGTSGTDRSHVLILNKGWADGLRPEQPVITPDGVVGKLRDVFPHSAQLVLLSDSSSGAGVILTSTRLRAILRGSSGSPDGEVQISNLTPDERIKPGERVITSGGDQVFPRGLPVGVITRIMMDPQHQPYTIITIKPAANLQQLEEVLVITGTSNDLPAAAQKDAALAETLAADNKRAADLIAERLPSLRGVADGADDSQTGASGASGGSGASGASGSMAAATQTVAQAGALPGIPNSGVPKVKLALHADRFSPGATPSAAELTPGAPAVSVSRADSPETSKQKKDDPSSPARVSARKMAPAVATSAHLSRPPAQAEMQSATPEEP